MPLDNYRLVIGRPRALALDDDESPHLGIHVDAAGLDHRIAVNVRSRVAPHTLLYARKEPFVHPLVDRLALLSPGTVDVRRKRPDLAVDFARGGLFSREEMRAAPYERAGPNNDLREFLWPVLQRAIAQSEALVYAFGETWGPEQRRRDEWFGFRPSRGVHDIHMNQGSSDYHAHSNGANQDGALLVRLADPPHWVAIFLAFQDQTFDTDPQTGHPIVGPQ